MRKIGRDISQSQVEQGPVDFEFAIVVPVLALMLVVAADFARVFHFRHDRWLQHSSPIRQAEKPAQWISFLIQARSARTLFADPLVVAYSWHLHVLRKSKGPQPFAGKKSLMRVEISDGVIWRDPGGDVGSS